MAGKQDKGLIGFDPLAWMEQDKANADSSDSAEGAQEDEDEWVDMYPDDEAQDAELDDDDPDDIVPTRPESNTESTESNDREFSAADEAGHETDEILAQDPAITNDPKPFAESHTTEDGTLELEATVTIQQVDALQQKLTALVNSNANIAIDVSAVQNIDAAGLQLLLVLKQSCAAENKEVSIDFPSDQFVESAQLLGLDRLLGVDKVASGLF